MQVRVEDLNSHLSNGLARAYLVTGDETLLVEEACDAVLRAAREAGFSERSVHHAEGSFRWHELDQDAASLSLFAERKVIDVRVPGGKFDKETASALQEYDAQPSEDTLLLIRAPRLQPRQRSSAWYKTLDKLGVIVPIWPISPAQLPRWLEQRARGRELQLQRDAVQYLADRVEGNLLAAAQEIEKLLLMDLEQPVSLEALAAALEDTSHFNSFDLIDAVMAGQPDRVVRILASLRAEGANLFAILGALTSQLRRLGQSQRLPPARQKLVDAFKRRVPRVAPVLAQCAFIDQQGKGRRVGDAWISLELLLLRLAGANRATVTR